jgi:hypothetical protein
MYAYNVADRVGKRKKEAFAGESLNSISGIVQFFGIPRIIKINAE